MEAVEGDDDLFVVIVGDEDDEYQNVEKGKLNFKIKDEVLDEETGMINVDQSEKVVLDAETGIMDVEYLLETAEKHGQVIDITKVKNEPEDEWIDEDEEYVPIGSDDNSEEEYLEKSLMYSKAGSGGNKDKSHRFTMRKPEEQKSFINDLRLEHPELREDKELLIETVSRVMLDVKRPPPPRDYFIMNNIMFECVVCGDKADTQPAIGRHWQEKHGPRYLICFACGVDFRSTTNLYKHEKRCSAPDAVIVLKARARSLGRKGRSRPFLLSPDKIKDLKVVNRHDKRRFQCSYCTAHFATKQSLSFHLNLHSGVRPYRCAHCSAAYTSSTALSRHQQKHMGVQFICDLCKRPFTSKPALIVHLDTHKPLRKHECGECGRRYAQKMALRLHIDRVHKNLPPPCACQICPKRYPRMSLLKNHMLREHGMNLITRKMFCKSLPLLSDTQIRQAKIVMKSDLTAYCEPVKMDKEMLLYGSEHSHNGQNLDLPLIIEEVPVSFEEQKEMPEEDENTGQAVVEESMDYEQKVEEYDETQLQEGTEYELGIENAAEIEELKEHLKKLQQGDIDNNTKYIVIHNGKAIYVDGDNIDFYKQNVLSHILSDDQEVVEMEYHPDLELSSKENVLHTQHIEALNENTEVESENTEIQDEVVSDTNVEVEVKSSDQSYEPEVLSETNRVVTLKNSDNIEDSTQTVPQSARVKLKEEC